MRVDKAMHIRTQSYILILTCVSLIALAGIHCGGGEDRAYSRGSTVIVAHPGLDGGGFNPDVTGPERYLVFIPLFTFNEQGELEGWLARSWEYSPDYREVTYHLRTDVRWHDGVSVTAHDIKFSMELMMHPDVLEESPGFFGSIAVLDDSTLRIRDGRGGIDEVFWPKHLLEHFNPKEFYDWEFWKHPVGNGPYRFVRYLPQTMMEFEANPDYFRGKPRIGRVILKFIGEAGLTDLLSGNVDAIMETNPIHIPKLAADPRFRVYHSYSAWWIQRAIYWQNDHPLFCDFRVRQALTHAIDRRELLRVLNLPETITIVDGPYSRRQLLRSRLPDPLPYDPERARTLLEAADWRDRNGDGIRDRDGREFRFTTLVGSLPFNKEVAVYIQDKFRRVGIIMNIQMMPNINVLAKVKEGQFEAALTVFVSHDIWLKRFHFGERYPLGYKNTRVVELIEQASAVLAESDAKDQIYVQLMEIFREDLPVTFLFQRVRTIFAHRRIKGLSSPWQADPLWYMEYLWLEDED